MKEVSREDLINELESVSAGLSLRETIEQSSCFVFKEGKVITYNDEIACSKKSCIGEIEGAVQSAPLISLLKKMTEEKVSVETNGEELLIHGKKRKAGIRFENEVLLPIDSIEEPGKWVPLKDAFLEAISIVQECSSNDPSQFIVSCIHIHPKWVEATDSYQITRYRLQTKISKPILVRKESIKHIVGLGVTKMSESDNWIHFKNPVGLIISCRRFEEDFPDLSDHLKVSGTPIVLPKGLKEAAERAEVFSSDNSENQITIDLKDNKLRCKGVGASGWFKEFKKVKYKGKPITFSISPKLLTELVQRHNQCEICDLETKDGSGKALKVDGGKFVYVTSLGINEDKKEQNE